MRRSPRPEAIRTGQEVRFIDRLHNHGDRPLRHLIFEGRDAERPLRAVRFRDVGPANRRRVVAAGFDAAQKVQQVGLQCRLVVGRRYAVDSRCPILAGQPIGLLHPVQIDNVMQ